MHALLILRMTVAVLMVSFVAQTYAGDIAEFTGEDKAPLPSVAPGLPHPPADGKVGHPPRGKGSTRSHGVSDALFGALLSQLGETFVQASAAAVIIGGINSAQRTYPSPEGDLAPREKGDAMIPFLAFDTCYQRAAGDVSAWDYRGEVGLAFLALQARSTFYEETTPDDDMTVTQIHGLYRMSFDETIEVDLGAGTMTIRDEKKETGFSVTTPVLLHPCRGFGLEWRPVWSSIKENRFSDNDLCMTFGWNYVSVRMGYRWVESDTGSLNGPQAGISLRW